MLVRNRWIALGILLLAFGAILGIKIFLPRPPVVPADVGTQPGEHAVCAVFGAFLDKNKGAAEGAFSGLVRVRLEAPTAAECYDAARNYCLARKAQGLVPSHLQGYFKQKKATENEAEFTLEGECDLKAKPKDE